MLDVVSDDASGELLVVNLGENILERGGGLVDQVFEDEAERGGESGFDGVLDDLAAG